jgi:hypothetical protein
MTKCLKTGMMNLKCVCTDFTLNTFCSCISTSSRASPAVCVGMEQGTELDPACVRLPRPHTSFKPWQKIVLFCLRYSWLFRSFHYCLFNLVVAHLSVSSRIVVYFVVLTYQPTPQKDSHVHRGMLKGLIFLYQHNQVLCDGSVTGQAYKLGAVFRDFEVPTTELCKYIRAIWYL